MANLTAEQQILLHEYQEASQACRNHDQLVRTGLTIFGAAQAVIVGFIGTQKGGASLALFLLEIFGFWLSVIVLLTTLRLQKRYESYMERAKCIERRVGMYLFECSQDYFAFASIPVKHFGNKQLWASVPVLAIGMYLILLGRDIVVWVRSIC